ncbi:hypothetical protein B4900_09280 [Yersinia rohdei]|nr:hypothetical protein B4900_09280 [Yersinia rohdei]
MKKTLISSATVYFILFTSYALQAEQLSYSYKDGPVVAHDNLSGNQFYGDMTLGQLKKNNQLLLELEKDVETLSQQNARYKDQIIELERNQSSLEKTVSTLEQNVKNLQDKIR